jgi:hypothetical protein
LPLLSFIACRLLVVLGLFRELNALERFLHTYIKQTINKVKITLEQAMKTQRGRRGIHSFFNLGARWAGWKVNTTPQPLDPKQRDLVPIVEKTGWAQGLIWMGM